MRRFPLMQDILADFFADTELSYPVIVARILGAAVVGAMIGIEREYQDHPAGLRGVPAHRVEPARRCGVSR